ncbi:MAG: NAD(P)-dependent dehydrogenase (short-subunit alcohol dehydrogenase family) [Myxococcota bacterium]|jgi:NAD(P)-dependent dehydrogenase (short-subunit alcohol dehydrogenase family)
MSNHKTVLVTGSNAGLGLEAARQLASKPEWDRIVLSARSEAKAQGARDTIMAATNRPASDFEYLILDLIEPASVDAALSDVVARDLHFDALVLNAGGMATSDSQGMVRASSGLSKLFAMNVGGHARLVEGLLAADRIRPGATVVFAGSEASRGIPMMRAKAAILPDGYANLDEALWAVASGDHVQTKVDDMYEYGLVKMLGTAWMTELAHRHGDQLRALSVSPGMTAGTSGADNMPGPMRVIMNWFAMPLMKALGKAHGVNSGAARYIQALEDDGLDNGGFYASPGTGLVGPLTLQSPEQQPLLVDEDFTRAVGRLVDRIATDAVAA